MGEEQAFITFENLLAQYVLTITVLKLKNLKEALKLEWKNKEPANQKMYYVKEHNERE